MNRVLKTLMLSDVLIFTGFGLTAPILAIFIKEDLTNGTIFAAGFATTLFIVVKSAVQLPFSRYVDSHDRKIFWLKLGTLLITLNPIIYIFADHVSYIYIAEAIHGLGSGLAFPTWLGLWSTHLDKGHESFEWSLYSTIVGVGAAVTAGVGAILAQFVGFQFTFLMVAIASFAGCVSLFLLEKGKEKKGGKIIKQYLIKKKVTSHRRTH